MKRQAFVFLNKWDESPAESYAQWLNSLLEQYPNAQIELHHSMSIAATSTDEFWFKICAVAIVTIDADFQQG